MEGASAQEGESEGHAEVWKNFPIHSPSLVRCVSTEAQLLPQLLHTVSVTLPG